MLILTKMTARRVARVDEQLMLSYVHRFPFPIRSKRTYLHLEERFAAAVEEVNMTDLIEHRDLNGAIDIVRNVLRGDPADRERVRHIGLCDLGPAVATLELNARRQQSWMPGEMQRAIEDTITGERSIKSLVFRATDLVPVLVELTRVAHKEHRHDDFFEPIELLPYRGRMAQAIVRANSDRKFAETLTRDLLGRLIEFRYAV